MDNIKGGLESHDDVVECALCQKSWKEPEHRFSYGTR